MMDLQFRIVGARPEPYASLPTVLFDVHLEETTGALIHNVMLTAQIRIEPKRRRYTSDEQQRLLALFGEPERWAETQQSILWTHVTHLLPRFEGSTTVALPVASTYDFEVSAAQYFQALDEGDIPLIFLFSGTAFVDKGNGDAAVLPLPWDREASFRLPLGVWRQAADAVYPNASWIRISRDTLHALQRYKAERARTTWDAAIGDLLSEGALP